MLKNIKKTNVIFVNKDVAWIGVIDYDIITFDVVMETRYNYTYNSYFINAQMPTIIETTKETFGILILPR